MSKKYRVHGEPHDGCKWCPTNVSDVQLIPVFSTNLASEAESPSYTDDGTDTGKSDGKFDTTFKRFGNFTPNSKANTVKMISMMIGPPISKMGLKILLGQVNNDIHNTLPFFLL